MTLLARSFPWVRLIGVNITLPIPRYGLVL